MLTPFSMPKSLRGHCEVIQQNAILSVPGSSRNPKCQSIAYLLISRIHG